MKNRFVVELIFKGEVEVEANKAMVNLVLSEFLASSFGLYGGSFVSQNGYVSYREFKRTHVKYVKEEKGGNDA